MFLTPRVYGQYRSAQDSILIKSLSKKSGPPDNEAPGPVYWSTLPPDVARYVKNMLLVHQTGSVRVGELVRYTLTYTPARDRVRPIPSHLHVRIRNTCAIALRAAYLHGPYTLYAACYPTAFNPNAKFDAETYGEPQFEPTLKAGGSWTATLKIPETIRQACDEPSSTGQAPEACTWIIECTSQVLFSTGAQVHYEVIVGRDERSVEVGFAGLTGSINSVPGRLIDHQESKKKPSNERQGPMKGIFSNAVTVLVEDTATLWDKPKLPGLDDGAFHEFKSDSKRTTMYPNEVQPDTNREGDGKQGSVQAPRGNTKPKRKVHLVLVSHGLHSNLGADMLYLKESIDAAAKQARIDARKRKRASLTKTSSQPVHDYTDTGSDSPVHQRTEQEAASTAPLSGGQEDLDDEPEEDEEEVIVRGFSGNAVRTERGIQYLGKRLAKYVLGATYPDQPYLPVKKSLRKTLSRTFTTKDGNADGQETHHHSSVRSGGPAFPHLERPYQITSISFIGHSLGGLTQMYAIAYIHKHSPDFFQKIQPINFIALASPLLGLSNENPLYVRFALDFGLVGRTGQDLGLTWRAPTIARSGWAGMIAGIGTEKQRSPKRVDPGTKPLLRLLPSGPAHQALRLFRNRTVYSNVVNDGIVPLRTSCLLFLDWRGLDRVEKARRENGLIGTMAGWGWAELTGTNSTEHRSQWPWQKQNQETSHDERSESSGDEADLGGDADAVPQPADDATSADYGRSSPEMKSSRTKRGHRRFWGSGGGSGEDSTSRASHSGNTQEEAISPLAGFMSFFGGSGSKKSKAEKHGFSGGKKALKAIKRAQTLKFADDESSGQSPSPSPEPTSANKSDTSPKSGNKASVGDAGDVFAPPKTSVFEAAGDLLNPPLPPMEFILDPQTRPRTIFHDRIYHPEDIPPPPIRRKSTFMSRKSGANSSDNSRVGSVDEQHYLPEPSPAAQQRPEHPDRSASSQSQGTTAVHEIGSMPVEEKIARAYHRDLSWRKVLVRLSPDAHNNMVVRRMFANAHGWPVVKHLVDTHFADTQAALTADRKEENTERARPMSESATEAGDEVRGQRKRARGDTVGDDERHADDERADKLGELKGRDETVGSLASSASWTRLSRAHPMDRQDSVSSTAWTDRFFEGGTDDDDDDSGDDEHAYNGVGSDAFRHYAELHRRDGDGGGDGDRGAETPRGTADADVDDFLHPHRQPASSKGKARAKEAGGTQNAQPGLILPVDKVVQSPVTLSPVAGLNQSLEQKMKLGGPSRSEEEEEADKA